MESSDEKASGGEPPEQASTSPSSEDRSETNVPSSNDAKPVPDSLSGDAVPSENNEENPSLDTNSVTPSDSETSGALSVKRDNVEEKNEENPTKGAGESLEVSEGYQSGTLTSESAPVKPNEGAEACSSDKADTEEIDSYVPVEKKSDVPVEKKSDCVITDKEETERNPNSSNVELEPIACMSEERKDEGDSESAKTICSNSESIADTGDKSSTHSSAASSSSKQEKMQVDSEELKTSNTEIHEAATCTSTVKGPDATEETGDVREGSVNVENQESTSASEPMEITSQIAVQVHDENSEGLDKNSADNNSVFQDKNESNISEDLARDDVAKGDRTSQQGTCTTSGQFQKEHTESTQEHSQDGDMNISDALSKPVDPSGSEKMNVNQDITAIAQADVAAECSEEAMETSSQNEENDPFFSCSEKEKDKELQMDVDESDVKQKSPSSRDQNSNGSSKDAEDLERPKTPVEVEDVDMESETPSNTVEKNLDSSSIAPEETAPVALAEDANFGPKTPTQTAEDSEGLNAKRDLTDVSETVEDSGSKTKLQEADANTDSRSKKPSEAPDLTADVTSETAECGVNLRSKNPAEMAEVDADVRCKTPTETGETAEVDADLRCKTLTETGETAEVEADIRCKTPTEVAEVDADLRSETPLDTADSGANLRPKIPEAAEGDADLRTTTLTDVVEGDKDLRSEALSEGLEGDASSKSKTSSEVAEGEANLSCKTPSESVEGEADLRSKTPVVGAVEDVNGREGDVVSSDKTLTSKDGDEDLCIVPDTAPRIPTDKEKAEAVEKASKVSGESSKDTSTVTIDENQDSAIQLSQQSSSIESSKDQATEKSQEKMDTSEESTEAQTNRDETSKSSRLQIVSTSSLLSSQTQEKELTSKDTDKSSDSVSAQQDASVERKCEQCKKLTKSTLKIKEKSDSYVCGSECYSQYRASNPPPTSMIRARKLDRSYLHRCGQCKQDVSLNDPKALTWETMDFCKEACLEKYQRHLGSHCANCKGNVQSSSLGKYCVRFGYDMKQFCCATCLEEFKKGLKVCSYCQKDISNGEGFLAPIGGKGQFKDFCSPACMEKYDQMSTNAAPPETEHECAVCNELKVVKVEVVIQEKIQKLCSEPCFAAFKFVNAVVADQCDMCRKYFDKDKTENFSVFYDDAPHSFCCKTCMNVYILAKRKIVPCTWCKVKKYNFDMIKKVAASGQVLMMCSLHCLTLYQVSVSAVSSKQVKCDMCSKTALAQYHLTMSDATVRNFCSQTCVMNFQGQFSKSPIPVAGLPQPVGQPKKASVKKSITSTERDTGSKSSTTMPVISSVTSLAPINGQAASTTNLSPAVPQVAKETVKTIYKQHILVKPPIPPERKNRAVQVKPLTHSKGVSCQSIVSSKETQTDEFKGEPVLIPVPVPIFIPVPMHMYSSPYPVPVPFPLPIPVPIFIPTTRNSAKGIFKEIKRIQEKIPSDPFEAELLQMAEIVAGESKVENTDTESEDDGGNDAEEVASGGDPAESNNFCPEPVDSTTTFGDDMLQMALKIANELDEPPVDFEAAVTPATITQSTPSQIQIDHNDESDPDDPEAVEVRTRSSRKRSQQKPPPKAPGPKRRRRVSSSDHSSVISTPEPGGPRVDNSQKPDANMCLKFTYGVNAWRHWVAQKNEELEKAATNTRKLKLFKREILQLTADELNYSLCLFVKEVRKPNGSEYAPDTIYYLCLGIQQYLIENSRVDNIFCDTYYEKFTECLDEVAKKFSVLYNDAQYIVTRVEEEHLWESKQLGAHSPYVLLSTLMFFNTKHFNLATVEEHMQLSFSHIMKHWKRNPHATTNAPKAPGSRNVLLRFYPPQSSLGPNSKKKKVYEQQENEDDALRCPVKLYEFYLSKCPESVKTRNDVFYLLPERSCVPDSPVWYSTMALAHEQLQKMLHRIKMVKEINTALLNG